MLRMIFFRHMEEIKLKAHAKLNLSLEITGKRSDGYHNIVSLMQGIDLSDILVIKKCAQNGTKYNLPHCTICGHVVYLCTDEKTIPTDMSNLALKGIEAVLKAAEGRESSPGSCLEKGAELLVQIEKRLPVAAGIAGGSGNAAAAMLGLNAITGYPFSLRELMAEGASVGADVPFSLFMNAYRNREILKGLQGIEEAGDAAWIGGIGDIVEAAEPVKRYVILANPGISVSTAEAYGEIDKIGYGEKKTDRERRLFVNDLEKYTLSKHSEAEKLKRLMEEELSADEVLMSGSGPTIAAYYRNKKSAEEDAKIMKKAEASFKGLRTWLTATGTAKEEA